MASNGVSALPRVSYSREPPAESQAHYQVCNSDDARSRSNPTEPVYDRMKMRAAGLDDLKPAHRKGPLVLRPVWHLAALAAANRRFRCR
jgi:hypothetical protein